jgi:hypothetical protein
MGVESIIKKSHYFEKIYYFSKNNFKMIFISKNFLLFKEYKRETKFGRNKSIGIQIDFVRV